MNEIVAEPPLAVKEVINRAGKGRWDESGGVALRFGSSNESRRFFVSVQFPCGACMYLSRRRVGLQSSVKRRPPPPPSGVVA